MTPEEFAERKAQLEAEHRRGMEMIEAVYREQLRVLELLLGGGRASEAAPAVAAVPAAGNSPSVSRPTPPVPAAPATVKRSSAQVWWDLQAALPRLPEVFTTPELARALGYQPHRGTLHRHIAVLEQQGVLRTEHRGEGRRLSRFRQLSPARAKDDPGKPPPAGAG